MRIKFTLLAAVVMCVAAIGFAQEAEKEAGKKNAEKLTTYNIYMSGVT